MNQLLFVYNAKSGIINTLFDIGHKLFNPKTYPCKLCALTYDTFSENTIWNAFREKHNLNIQFYHIDEFEKAYPDHAFSYPIILKRDDDSFQIIASKEDIGAIDTSTGLIELLSKEFSITL